MSTAQIRHNSFISHAATYSIMQPASKTFLQQENKETFIGSGGGECKAGGEQ